MKTPAKDSGALRRQLEKKARGQDLFYHGSAGQGFQVGKEAAPQDQALSFGTAKLQGPVLASRSAVAADKALDQLTPFGAQRNLNLSSAQNSSYYKSDDLLSGQQLDE